MKTTITYAASTVDAQGFEVMSCGLLVGTIRQAGADTFTARPHRYKTADFQTMQAALDYFEKCFPLGAGTAQILGDSNKLQSQLQMF